MTEQTKSETVILVFCGVTVGKGEQRLQLWLPVSDSEIESGELEGDQSWEDRVRAYVNLQEKGRPGLAYLFEQKQGTTEVSTPGEYVGEWKGQELRALWGANHDHNLARLETIAQKKKAGKRNLLYELLEPIRKVYQQTPQSQRGVLLMRISDFLARGEKS